MTASKVKQELKKHQHPDKAAFALRFFKAGKGQYAEGDKFLGVSVPNIRKIANQFKDISLEDIQTLLDSAIHEHRYTALHILILQYKAALKKDKEKLVKFYLKNTKNVNNWDLVDASAHAILGDFLLDKEKDILKKLAKSKMMWERRIAMVATWQLIRNNQLEHTIELAKILLDDTHDLMHKAVGWMLREMGKKDQKKLEQFLDRYHKKMPRTMLRYSIERLPEKKRKHYMKR